MALTIIGILAPQMAFFVVFAPWLGWLTTMALQAFLLGCFYVGAYIEKQNLLKVLDDAERNYKKWEQVENASKSSSLSNSLSNSLLTILGVIHELAGKLKMQVPTLVLRKGDDHMAASCTYNRRHNPYIFISQGFLEAHENKLIDDNIVSGVLAHEFSHLYHREILETGTLLRSIRVFNASIAIVCCILLIPMSILPIVNLFAAESLLVPHLFYPVLMKIAVSALTWPLAYFSYLSFNRAQEFRADRFSAELTNNPTAVLHYLKKSRELYIQNGNRWTADSFGNEKAAIIDTKADWYYGIHFEKLTQILFKKLQRTRIKSRRLKLAQKHKEFFDSILKFEPFSKSHVAKEEVVEDDSTDLSQDKALTVMILDKVKALNLTESELELVIAKPEERKVYINQYDTFAEQCSALYRSLTASHPSYQQRKAALAA